MQENAEAPPASIPTYSDKDKECLVRAMYFESNRSSDDGLLALGSVVMNRVNSGMFPNTICGVVGQSHQFATGVLTKPMSDRERERADRIAAQVLDGKRHPQVASAMYFHMAGLRFHYPGMHYVLVAGGNAFYERKRRERHDASLVAAGSSPTELSDLFEDNHFALDVIAVRPGATASSLPQPQ
jgi:spore germination cell wall hydrolase CwlJ-like protein